MTILLILAVFLAAAAVAALVMAGRLTVKARLRHWNGEVVSVNESHRLHARIQGLRIAAGICAALVVVDLVAIITLVNYAAVH